jgi:DnaK suppressor protein
MAAKKASGKASKHKAAAPKKAIAKRAKPAKRKAVVHRTVGSASHRKATPPHKRARPAEKTQAVSKSAVKLPEKGSLKGIDKNFGQRKPLERPKPPGVATFLPLSRPTPLLQSADADGDDDANASLLAGPRNVRPYIARRGEQYMNKEQLDHFRLILHTWKRDLMEEVDRTVLHMKDEAANFPDPNDRATQESEFSLELRTRDRERKLIRKIDEALKRIEDGSYGYCLETGEEIGIKRLEARPVATLCVEAQERRERREKQYGDRDDRYR